MARQAKTADFYIAFCIIVGFVSLLAVWWNYVFSTGNILLYLAGCGLLYSSSGLFVEYKVRQKQTSGYIWAARTHALVGLLAIAILSYVFVLEKSPGFMFAYLIPVNIALVIQAFMVGTNRGKQLSSNNFFSSAQVLIIQISPLLQFAIYASALLGLLYLAHYSFG